MRAHASLLVAVAFLLPVAVSAQPAVHDSSATMMACPVLPTPGCLPKDSELDTTWVRLGKGLKGCRILNHRDLWAVEMPWMKIDGTAGILRFSELDSLRRAGVITDSTIFSVRRYRFPVKARTLEEARVAAQERQPLEPPREILKAFTPKASKSKSAAPATK